MVPEVGVEPTRGSIGSPRTWAPWVARTVRRRFYAGGDGFEQPVLLPMIRACLGPVSPVPRRVVLGRLTTIEHAVVSLDLA
jgi:hypothetical protein